MQISTKFTIGIHLLAAVEYFGKDHKVTSQFLAASIGSNPVIVRNIMVQLQNAGLIDVKRGPGGISLTRPLKNITFLDVYDAVETNSADDLFRFHENPNPECPVGRNIHSGLDSQLREIQENFKRDLAGRNIDEVYDTIYSNISSEKMEKKK